jgi:hypothetical protein
LEVAAVQYLGKPDAHNSFAGYPTREDPLHHQTVVLVQTAQGGRPAFAGDWIVTDSEGKSSVVKDADFRNKFVVDAPVAPSVVVPVSPVVAVPAPPVAPVPVAPSVVVPVSPVVAVPAPPVAPVPVAPVPVAPVPVAPSVVEPAKQPTPSILT